MSEAATTESTDTSQGTSSESSEGLLGGGASPPATTGDANGSVWADLPEPLRTHPEIQRTKDVPTLAKRFVDLRSHLTKVEQESLSPPGEDWTEQDFAKLWNRLGRPEDPSDFNPEVHVPEGAPVSETLIEGAKQLLYDNGMAPWQAERIMNGFLDLQATELATLQAGAAEVLSTNKATLEGEWGEHFEARLNRAKQAQDKVMEAAGFEDLDLLRSTVLPNGQKFGDTLAFVKVFDTIAQHISEDSLMPGEETHKTMSPDEAERKWNEFTNENVEILMDKGHPLHAQTQEEYQRLARLASGKNADAPVIEAEW